jgi:hypothetical protein
MYELFLILQGKNMYRADFTVTMCLRTVSTACHNYPERKNIYIYV